jgi:hypothetical protein
MTNRKSTNRPTHRISFARIVGHDQDGKDRLGTAREIGAVWPRAQGEGGILRFDHIPIEMTQHGGVLFVTPIDAKDEGDRA